MSVVGHLQVRVFRRDRDFHGRRCGAKGPREPLFQSAPDADLLQFRIGEGILVDEFVGIGDGKFFQPYVVFGIIGYFDAGQSIGLSCEDDFFGKRVDGRTEAGSFVDPGRAVIVVEQVLEIACVVAAAILVGFGNTYWRNIWWLYPIFTKHLAY